MNYLVDTNILLRYADRTQKLQPVARHSVRTLWKNGDHLSASSQNFVEFWYAASRPKANNGLGLSLIATERRLRLLERAFPLLSDHPAIYAEWRRLIVMYGVSGNKVYDTRLVAAMKVYSLTHILTFITADFARYAPEGIVAVDPATV